MKHQKIRSLTAIGLRLGAFALALWLVCMVCITYGTAQYVFEELCEEGSQLAQNALYAGHLEYMYSDEEEAVQMRSMPGAVQYGMQQSIAQTTAYNSSASTEYFYPPIDWPSIYTDKVTTLETAFTILDPEGNNLQQSDYVYFPYVTESVWIDETAVAQFGGYGWLDVSDREDSRHAFLWTQYNGTKDLHDFLCFRLTGYFEDSRFEPVAMAVLNAGTYDSVANPDIHSNTQLQSLTNFMNNDHLWSNAEQDVIRSVRRLDAQGLLEWHQRFDHSGQYDPQELTTIYAFSPRMLGYDAGTPVTYRGAEHHDSLLALLQTMTYYNNEHASAAYGGASDFDLWDMVIFSAREVHDYTAYTPESGLPTAFTVMAAMRASPIRIAMSYLWGVYLVTFLLLVAGYGLLMGSIRKNLTRPMALIDQGITDQWANVQALYEKESRWAEPFALSQHYSHTQEALQRNADTITRLETALGYARTAEKNRRQLTSNIAHELKTPLAIVHSYAEGLKEHIAEDKREQYLDTILAETQRMDAMVMELLDLSRLEAGKVTLSREAFFLDTLTRSVWALFEPMAQEKQLQVTLELEENCWVVADEARIGQVLRNFMSNAVRYTPQGGTLVIKAYTGRKKICFSIENTAEHFSDEALRKVWDTFYRTDPARSGKGTGLGLAIAKNIISLHGGSCQVQNTDIGVKFSFRL